MSLVEKEVYTKINLIYTLLGQNRFNPPTFNRNNAQKIFSNIRSNTQLSLSDDDEEEGEEKEKSIEASHNNKKLANNYGGNLKCDFDKDDLEIVLSWMDPNDGASFHNFKPPSLRIKQSINKIFSTGAAIEQLILNIYFIRVRQHFFSHYDKIQTLRQAFKLESLYTFPSKYCFLTFHNLFKSEILVLRKYLINKNALFWKNLRILLQNYNKEDEFNQLEKVFQWINNVTESRTLIVDFLMEKIGQIVHDFCKDEKSWYQDNVTLQIYEIFIENYWNVVYKHLLNIKDNNTEEYEFIKEIKLLIIKHYANERALQSFQLCVESFPKTLPSLWELSLILEPYPNLKYKFGLELSKQINKNLLFVTVPTTTILYSYLLLFKAILFLDRSTTMAKTVLSKTASFLRDRLDISKILLYSLFELTPKEIAAINSNNSNGGTASISTNNNALQEDYEILTKINKELKASLFIKYAKDTNNGDVSTSVEQRRGGWFYDRYISWSPEPIQSVFGLDNHGAISDVGLSFDSHIMTGVASRSFTNTEDGNNNIKKVKDGFDAVLDIIFRNNKNKLMHDVTEIFKQILLNLKYYKLDIKWIKNMVYLKNKLKKQNFGKSSLATTGTTTRTTAAAAAAAKRNNTLENVENDVDGVSTTNLDVMFHDIKQSEIMYHQGIVNDSSPLVPKIISYLYWDMNSDTGDGDSLSDVILPDWLNAELYDLNKRFHTFKHGRKLRMYSDKGTVDVNITFQDGRFLKLNIPLPVFLVLNCFSSNDIQDVVSNTINDIVKTTHLKEQLVTYAIKYLVKIGILYYNNSLKKYAILENLKDLDKFQNHYNTSLGSSDLDVSIKNGKPNGGKDLLLETNEETGGGSETDELINNMNKVYPFIQGMLTNLGSLKPDKIHSFLRMAVPKDIGYNYTVSQLELYLNHLVDEEKLTINTNGTYKLNK
ncbi:uncharacterized protein SCODWIG_03701 [Saccharomycodes ludwigii]|uniref:Anaphase-promoting complex subunit 2 n=1 Tax=Saccharomycodes ludwigii TaxID=36035 RepID=A0A376BCT9_9ASCO|nr:uncharacterized protein SCODWIG_03701 [Saccharomycodes ludwigii]